MKLHQKIFGIGLVTAVIVPHLFDKGYSSQAATEKVQKLRVEYWETIKHIEPENMVFLEETGILRSFSKNLCPFATGDKSILIKTILSRD